MRDGSDAVSDWPLLNALLNCASGATWVSLHHGGGVGMGFSQHAGMVIVCDGTPEAGARIERVLWNDPASGVMRHADAGYDIAIDCARQHHLDLPGQHGAGRVRWTIFRIRWHRPHLAIVKKRSGAGDRRPSAGKLSSGTDPGIFSRRYANVGAPDGRRDHRPQRDDAARALQPPAAAHCKINVV